MIFLTLTDSVNSPELKETSYPQQFPVILVKFQKQMRSKIDLGKKPKDYIISLVIPIHSLMWKW